MAFLTPILLLLGLLAVPIILVYMLRLRRHEQFVSSTMLWQKLMRDREANAPWQKLRRNILLLLQLVILGALVIALARPFIPIPSIVSGNMVVLLDGSASMLAKDVAPDRFTFAKATVTDLIDNLGGGDRMTLILVGHTPQVLASASSDKVDLLRVLDTANAQPVSADWQSAVALAAGAAQGFRDARIVIVSDGGLPDDLPPMPAEVIFVPIGSNADNLAISALATRESATGSQLLASVTNYGLSDRQALFSINIDGMLFDSRQVIVPAGEAIHLDWVLPDESGIIGARLSNNDTDYLSLDDLAWTIRESGVNHRVLIVTEGNRFLETAFSELPGIEAFRVSPDNFLAGELDDVFDLYVLDSITLPDPLPLSNLFIINPQPNQENATPSEPTLLSTQGVFTGTDAIQVVDSPLLRYINWDNIHVRQATLVDAPWAQTLVDAQEGPLLLAGEHQGRRIAILTFGLQDSDLPLQIAFPVLTANIIAWLNPGQVPDVTAGFSPGDAVTIKPGLGATTLTVHRPDGTYWSSEVGEEELVFADTNWLGMYEIAVENATGESVVSRISVNLMAPAESSIEPRQTIKLGQTAAESTEEDVGQKELWPWLAALAIIILMTEWWVYHQGTNPLTLFNRRLKFGRRG